MMRMLSLAPRRSLAGRLSLAASWLAILSLAASLTAQEPQDENDDPKPANRLEEIERISKEFAPGDPYRQYGPEHRITISGEVVTADGSPLPENLYVGGISHRSGFSGSLSARVNEEGRFTATAEFGRVGLYVTAPGYAPALVGPLEAEPGGKIENVRIALQRGFTATIRLTDADGQPIAGAKIKTAYMHGQGGSFVHVASRETTTSAEGLLVLENCPDHPLTAEAESAGFQPDKKEFKLRADEVVEWQLKRARPTTGRVVTREDGRPIAGAEVRLVQREGFNPRTYSPFDESPRAPLLAKTDEEGKFTLDSLRDDSTYTVYVTAPDRGAELVLSVRSGQSDRKVELGSPRYVKGRIIGDLSRLPRRSVGGIEERYFHAINPLRLGHSLYHYPMAVPVKIEGDEGTFEVKNLLAGQLRLDFPGLAKTLQVSEALDDVVIELPRPQATPKPAPAAEAGPRRKVVLKLKTPEGEPAPRGELVVHCFARGPAASERKSLPVENGQVEFDAPVPCRLQWQAENLIGYWVKVEQTELAEAPTPFVKEIDALPAGAVYGQVLEPDGSPCQTFNLQVHTVSPPPQVQNAYLGVNSFVNAIEGRFVAGPLPLGGVYCIQIQGQGERANTRLVSEDISLTREESVRRIELRLPEGATVAGQVLDPDGRPVAGVEVRLGHRSGNRSHEGASQHTDTEGRFQFVRVNTDLPGTYYLHVQPHEHYRGQNALWKPEGEFVVHLKRGWKLEGVLVEHASGKVIPGAVLYAQPAVYNQNYYLARHEVRTDASGRFRFSTLEPMPYRFFANGVNVAQGAPPWEADPRATGDIILSGDVARGSELLPVPPPPDDE